MLRYSDPLWTIIDPDTGQKYKAHALLDTVSGWPLCFVLENSPTKKEVMFCLQMLLPKGEE